MHNSLCVISGASLGSGVKHGFFTRSGGVSSGIYQSLNCGFSSRDKTENVAENRRRASAWFAERAGAENTAGAAARQMPCSPVLTPRQYHSDTVITVEAPWRGEAPQGDAAATKLENCPIGILTADCGAVLLADSAARVIGAAHAGWKGALSGILQNTVEAMLRLGAKAENIRAVSGPSISPQNYEVGAEFRQRFLDKNTAYRRYFTPWAGKSHNLAAASPESAGRETGAEQTYHCDLWAFIHDRLAEKGVRTENLRVCTYADEKRFFSYRRATHYGEADYGRQLSAIMLTKA